MYIALIVSLSFHAIRSAFFKALISSSGRYSDNLRSPTRLFEKKQTKIINFRHKELKKEEIKEKKYNDIKNIFDTQMNEKLEVTDKLNKEIDYLNGIIHSTKEKMKYMINYTSFERVFDNEKLVDKILSYLPFEYYLIMSSLNKKIHFHLYYKLRYNYIEKKYHLKGKDNIYFLKDNTSFCINKSCCWIKTDKHLKEILCIFYIYHKNIFVCNFETNEYFWLRDKFHSKCI